MQSHPVAPHPTPIKSVAALTTTLPTCAVAAVRAVIEKTPNASHVLMSAWMPAPPPESDPAMISTRGTSDGVGRKGVGGPVWPLAWIDAARAPANTRGAPCPPPPPPAPHPKLSRTSSHDAAVKTVFASAASASAPAPERTAGGSGATSAPAAAASPCTLGLPPIKTAFWHASIARRSVAESPTKAADARRGPRAAWTARRLSTAELHRSSMRPVAVPSGANSSSLA